MYQFSYVKVFRTNQNGNLVLFDDPGRVRSQITSVACQIQRFDFDCNLVVTRKLIIRIPPPLRSKPLYRDRHHPIHRFFLSQGFQAKGLRPGIRSRVHADAD